MGFGHFSREKISIGQMNVFFLQKKYPSKFLALHFDPFHVMLKNHKTGLCQISWTEEGSEERMMDNDC